jgi:hypothetical protein
MINTFIKNLSNLPGWNTKRKIIVIESDDWGSIRMPSINALKSLKLKGLTLEKGDAARFNKYDTLASSEDLAALYETLTAFKDHKGNHPMFTAVSLTANPDFDKIKKNNFQEYFYEPFTETLSKYNRGNAKKLWEEGIQSNLFVPEFHGREHLNVKSWMRALRDHDKETHLAFDYGCWGFNRTNQPLNFQAAFDLEFPEDIEFQKFILSDGLALFDELHGFRARFFVPPNGPFNTKLETITAESGVQYVSTPKIHKEPQGNQKFKKKLYWLGKKNKLGQTYITRNAFFEPNCEMKGYGVSDCLSHIENAFKYKKPAIISTHRINYIGANIEANRKQGNESLHTLLHSILKKWPDVEFMTSTQLGNLINNDKK